MNGSKFIGQLNMDSVSIGRSLIMSDGDEYRDVDLRGARIDGQVSMIGSKFLGKFIMNSASIGRDLFIKRARFERPVHLAFTEIGSNLDARSAEIRELNLTGAKVKRELRLGASESETVIWKWTEYTIPKLTLKNTQIGFLQHTNETWPKVFDVEFEGFTFGSLGGIGKDVPNAKIERRGEWYLNWLGMDRTFSPSHTIT